MVLSYYTVSKFNRENININLNIAFMGKESVTVSTENKLFLQTLES